MEPIRTQSTNQFTLASLLNPTSPSSANQIDPSRRPIKRLKSNSNQSIISSTRPFTSQSTTITSTNDLINSNRSLSHPIISATSHHQSTRTSSDSNLSIDQSNQSTRTPSESQRSISLPTELIQSDQIQSNSSEKSEKSMNLDPSDPLEGLEESIFGIGAYDDFIASIGRFIWNHAKPYCERNEGHLIEVEAKLGIIKPKHSGSSSEERMYFPVENESALINLESNRFETNMTEKQHKSFNELLNIRVMETNQSDYVGSKIKYSHLKDIDEFYDHQIRIRKSQTNGEIKESIIKQKLGSLDITCPSRLFDFRISVNLERPVPLPPPDAIPHYRRIKDRLSYEHQICQIDLTQVKTDDPNVKVQHELEVEIKEIQTLLNLADKWKDGSGDPSYLIYLKVWLNNVRLLIRNSIEP